MNRIDQLFSQKKNNILSVYFTAGFPERDDTVAIINELEACGVDLIEIGMPFSDPLADGPVIQKSSQAALQNGMSIKLLFEQLSGIRKKVNIPLILMGYINPVLRYGVERFCQQAAETGIDGIILPDLPLYEYNVLYRKYFEVNGLHNILLITPQTSDERVKAIDQDGSGFIYMVSSSATTGAKSEIAAGQEQYFKRIAALPLTKPKLIGFGISSHETFTKACRYAHGAIIGSAFIRALEGEGSLKERIRGFVKMVRGEH